MQLTSLATLEKREHSDVLVLPFWQRDGKPIPAAALGSLKTQLAPALTSGDFRAKAGELLWLYGRGPEEKRIVLLGLGPAEGLTLEGIRRGFGACVASIGRKQVESMTCLLPEAETLTSGQCAHAAMEGILLANYHFVALRHDTLKEQPSTVTSVCLIAEEPSEALDEARRVLKTGKGVAMARDLINRNADEVTPQYLATSAKALARRYGRISTTIHNQAWIAKNHLDLLDAVGKGAKHPPVFIVATYRGNPASTDHTVLIGKGVTYDTGGLNLKPTGFMETMKSDMSGAAAVLGTLCALAELQLPVNVTAVIASCENAIGSAAYKPGDVYSSLAKTTVEIANTDAEGRLTLADALAYTEAHLKPSRIIDLATLTGSAVVALGHEAAALYATSDTLGEELFQAGERVFERVWKMPLYDEYEETLKSDVADLKNAGGREGGSIIAARFLKHFVKKTPWAHLDIAGTAFLKEKRRYLQPGATGYGVRLLVDYLQHLAAHGS